MLWLSLGENCLPDVILKRHGKKSFREPLNKSGLSFRTQRGILENQVRGFLAALEMTLVQGFPRIGKALPDIPLIVLGHLAGERFPCGERLAHNRVVSAAALMVGAHNFDVGPLVDECGFTEVNGRKDIHHLSLEGEDAMGRLLLQVAGSLLEPAGSMRKGEV